MPNPLESDRRVRALNEYLNENLGLNYVKRKKDELMGAADNFIQEHVVNPISQAGYPNAGAGLGAAISAPLQLASDSVPTNIPDVMMSAVPVPGSKAFSLEQRAGLMKHLEGKFANRPDMVAKGMQQLEEQQLARQAGRDLGDASQLQRGSKSAEAQKAFATQPAAPGPVHDASDVSRLPQASQTARQYESALDEYARKNKPTP